MEERAYRARLMLIDFGGLHALIQENNAHYIFIPQEISVLIVIKNVKKCVKKTASRDLRLTVFHSSIYIIF